MKKEMNHRAFSKVQNSGGKKEKRKNSSLITHPNSTPIKFGQRAADRVTKIAGSWGFILGFIGFLILWMAVNAYAWMQQWDPYPFILLNLVLSCLAALQAPIILMSQNRTSERDRQRAEYDYAVNRKAEREIQEIKKLIHRVDRKIK
ncbi:MAG: DUF1003 domain-containing protein [Nanoarchaeota archaeon]|nr:DUF1003 domain-containing protein [Nanoarchaeota archaeon]